MQVKERVASILKSSSTLEVLKKLSVTFLIVAFTLGTVSNCISFSAQDVPNKTRVRRPVSKLDFLSPDQQATLVLSIYTGAQDSLLDFTGAIGTETLLDAIATQDAANSQKLQFVQTYQDVLSEELPVFLVTKTSIRLLRTGAPFSTVLSTVRTQHRLLRKIRKYIQQESGPLYLTYRNKARLIDTLAESVATFNRQRSREDNTAVTKQEVDELKRITYNMVKFSSLPVSLQSGAGSSKGAATGDSTNPQLSEFLGSQETIRDLAELAQRLYQ